MFIIKDIGLVGSYYVLNKIFEKYCDKKVARNFVCVAHASTSVVMNTMHLMTGNYLNLALDISKGYFLYDLYYMLNIRLVDVKREGHRLSALCQHDSSPGAAILLVVASTQPRSSPWRHGCAALVA